MSNEFTREDRYIVFKLSDVERYLTDADRAHLAMMKNEIDAGRDCANKPPFKGLIVESDWPEYEPTWRAIEARATGAQPAPSEQDESVRKAWARFSHELNHSPDAPYPGMSEAFEQHFSQSFIDREWRAESATWAAAWKAAKRHEAQAQPVPSVPEDVKRDAERYRYLRARDDGTAGVGCWLEADGRVCDRGWLYGVQLDSAIDSFIEVLAAAPKLEGAA